MLMYIVLTIIPFWMKMKSNLQVILIRLRNLEFGIELHLELLGGNERPEKIPFLCWTLLGPWTISQHQDKLKAAEELKAASSPQDELKAVGPLFKGSIN